MSLTAGAGLLARPEILAPLGAGGMGEVYRARDTRLDRVVAVKVLPPHIATDPQLKQRFEIEARTLAALSHPHICSIFDVGRSSTDSESVAFLVMDTSKGRRWRSVWPEARSRSIRHYGSAFR